MPRMFSDRTRFDLRPNRLAERLAERRGRGREAHRPDAVEPDPRGPARGPGAARAARRRRGPPLRPAALRPARGARRGRARLRARAATRSSPSGSCSTPAPARPTASCSSCCATPATRCWCPARATRSSTSWPASSRSASRSYALAYDGQWHLDLGALAAAARPPHARDRGREPRQPHGRLPEARRALRARGALRRARHRARGGRGVRGLPAPRGRAAGPRASRATRPRSPSRSAGSRRAAACRSSSSRGRRSSAPSRCGARRWRGSRSWPTATCRCRRRCRSQQPALLARKAELQAPIRARVAGNLDALRQALAPGSPATLLEPEGGWSAVLRVPATCSEEERALRLLDERDVLVHPGYFFDFPSEAYLVLSLLPPPAEFARGRRPGARRPRAITAAGGPRSWP